MDCAVSRSAVPLHCISSVSITSPLRVSISRFRSTPASTHAHRSYAPPGLSSTHACRCGALPHESSCPDHGQPREPAKQQVLLQLVKGGREHVQRLIHHHPNGPQGMLRRHVILRRKITEHRALLGVLSSHNMETRFLFYNVTARTYFSGSCQDVGQCEIAAGNTDE